MSNMNSLSSLDGLARPSALLLLPRAEERGAAGEEKARTSASASPDATIRWPMTSSPATVAALDMLASQGRERAPEGGRFADQNAPSPDRRVTTAVAASTPGEEG